MHYDHKHPGDGVKGYQAQFGDDPAGFRSSARPPSRQHPARRGFLIAVGTVATGAAASVAGAFVLDGLYGAGRMLGRRSDKTRGGFLDLAIDWYRSYHGEPIVRQAPLRPDDRKDVVWIEQRMGFRIAPIDLENLGYAFQGYDHYPWGDDDVLVYVYANGDNRRLNICVTEVRDDQRVVAEEIGNHRNIGYFTFQTNREAVQDSTKAVAVVGKVDRQTLYEAGQRAEAAI